MAVIATDTTRYSAVVKYEFEPTLGLCRESVILNDVAATLKVGTVLGKVTATGKYKVALSGASDGSQNPVAVLIANGLGSSHDIVLPATTDTKALVMARGQVILAGEALTLGTGITLSAVKTAFAALNPPMTVETAI